LKTIKPQYVDITASTSFIPTAGVIGTNGYVSTVTWNNFPELVAMVELFQYFEVTGYKLDFALNPSIATFYEGACAFRPVNTVVGEAASSTAPTASSQLQELPGAIWLQQGTGNKGKWCKPTCKQVYSTRASITGALAAGNFLIFINNVGAIETFGGTNVYVNVRLYGKQYSAST